MSELEKDLQEHMPEAPTETEQEAPQEQSQQQPESDKERNLRILRERAEQAERRALELEYAMKMAESNKKKPQEEPEPDDFAFDDDSYIEGKQLKQALKKTKKELQEMRKMFEETSTRNATTAAELKLKAQYPDFDAVVSTENIKKLASAKPALYRSIMANRDLYDQGETAYEMIKAMVKPQTTQVEDRKLEANKTKPRSASTAGGQAGDTPLSHIADYDRRTLTEDRRAQIRREIMMNKQRGS